MALEATTGWRFVVEELERIGAEVHLAEPAEAAALKGKQKRAKTDWADARHLRELLLIGRLPESWIPPAHILDLRARVRTRHLLSHQRREWQQRIHSVLYHHGFPQRRSLATSPRRNRYRPVPALAGKTAASPPQQSSSRTTASDPPTAKGGLEPRCPCRRQTRAQNPSAGWYRSSPRAGTTTIASHPSSPTAGNSRRGSHLANVEPGLCRSHSPPWSRLPGDRLPLRQERGIRTAVLRR